MRIKNSHCSYCGHEYEAEASWPRKCANCATSSYQNPTPVVVVLMPIENGLLCIRRNIEPGKGKLALPGGYIDIGETWQKAAAREVMEETGIRIAPDEVKEHRVLSSESGDGILLIFGLARRRTMSYLPTFRPTEETSECVILSEPEEMAFPLHTQAVREYFAHKP